MAILHAFSLAVLVPCLVLARVTAAKSINACSFQAAASVQNATSGRVTAWVEQPNYRGTFDVLWTSLVTIGISTYTMLCLNVPSPKDRYVQLVGRRVLWMILGIMGPEFVLTYAAGQWSRAKWSVRAFKESGIQDWHMRQAFFADMGGFVFHAKDAKPFPLNATQLHWLVQHRYIEYPSVSRREIWDKLKQDTFTKVITAFQVSYLISSNVVQELLKVSRSQLSSSTPWPSWSVLS
jgi:hypothetical protein